jgi:hypothetical protein
MSDAMQKIEDWLDAQCEQASVEWLRLQSCNLYGAYYLYYQVGALKISSAATPDGFTLADSRRLGPSGDRLQIKAFIASVARRLPILPVELR